MEQVNQKAMREAENDLFQTKKFDAMGEADNYTFQALVFIGEASAKLSVAHTVLKRDPRLVHASDLFNEFRHLQTQVHELANYIRNMEVPK